MKDWAVPDRPDTVCLCGSARFAVVNPGGYVGESTTREIAYARAADKDVSFTDPGVQADAAHE